MALVRIRYKGLSDVRAITVKDAEAYGVKLSQDLVWDHVGSRAAGDIPGVKRPANANARRGIVVDGLSDELLSVLRAEGTFTISEITDDGSDGDDIITGEPLDDTGSAVVDTTTGQRSVAGESNSGDAGAAASASKAAKKAASSGSSS